MARLQHGVVPTTKDLEQARDALAKLSAEIPLSFSLSAAVDLHDFDFMFPGLQTDPDNLLPETADMPEKLKALGRAMEDPDNRGPNDDSPIPAAYTYFGQFVDHDITLEVQDFPTPLTGSLTQLLAANMSPVGPAALRNAMRNARSATLDLDSLYGLPAAHDPDNGDKMAIGLVTNLGATTPPFERPAGKSDDNDLPREPPSPNVDHDRAALIGDPRNDENTIVAQLHLAFLKAHNQLVDEGRSRAEAETVLRQHYQHIVVHDYLKRIADPAIVDDILTNGNQHFDALSEAFFMPIEFSGAAYRFGHTMVRNSYSFNSNFQIDGQVPATLKLLFTFTALNDNLGAANTDTLPENWIIEWENIIGDDPGVGKARRFDTQLAAIGDVALFALPNTTGATLTPPDAARLSVRNLLRGYRMRIPTGQAVAAALGLPALTPAELQAAAGTAQATALTDGGFDQKTPLWYYVLAEAAHHGGQRLGPVGSTLVAEVLIGLVRRSQDSILAAGGWTPTLPSSTPGTFQLSDLLRFAGVLGSPSPATIYVVKARDTLGRIAQNELGDRNRWPEIFLVNRSTIRDPNRIFVGQMLNLPSGPPMVPQPRIYVVRRGDTLSGIAADNLNDASRWPEIFELNRIVITNPNLIVAGLVLILPQ